MLMLVFIKLPSTIVIGLCEFSLLPSLCILHISSTIQLLIVHCPYSNAKFCNNRHLKKGRTHSNVLKNTRKHGLKGKGQNYITYVCLGVHFFIEIKIYSTYMKWEDVLSVTFIRTFFIFTPHNNT